MRALGPKHPSSLSPQTRIPPLPRVDMFRHIRELRQSRAELEPASGQSASTRGTFHRPASPQERALRPLYHLASISQIGKAGSNVESRPWTRTHSTSRRCS